MALLENGIKDLPEDDVVAGNFNTSAIEWGMTQTNKRGRLLLKMATRLDLVVPNTGNTATYRRPGFGNSILDVTLTTYRILPRVKRWRVIEDYLRLVTTYVQSILERKNADGYLT